MNNIKDKVRKIIFILIFCYFFVICIQTPVLTPPQQIIVDVNKVIANVDRNPIGINLNFLLDRKTIATALKDFKISRFFIALRHD